jgi:hypothetical protein
VLPVYRQSRATLIHMFSLINSTKNPALGAGNYGEPMLMLQVAIVCAVVCLNKFISAVRAVEVAEIICLHRSAMMRLR